MQEVIEESVGFSINGYVSRGLRLTNHVEAECVAF
jgi:hypothetical protein